MNVASVLWRMRTALVGARFTSDRRVGLGLIALSVLITIIVGALGPSSVALDVGPAPGLLPPWFIGEDARRRLRLPLSEWIVAPALWIGIAVGGVGLAIASRAVAAGWRPKVRVLFAIGAVLSLATACVPPMTSADVLMYAAYGRLTRLGVNPYTISPADVFRAEFDPVLVLTERPWQDTPSVYGPIASASQWAANMLGGDSMHDVVFWLQMFCVIPFIIICAVLVKLAHDDPERQARAVLFTICNPLLIWAVVAGAHNEPLTLVFAICALWFVRRSPFVTGLFIGLAGAVKVSLIFYGIALAWGYRRDRKALMQLVVGALIPLAIAYGVFAPDALFASLRNTGYISQGNWALPFEAVLEAVFGKYVAWNVVTKMAWPMLIVVAWMLSRVVPWEAVPGAKVPARDDPLTIATRTALVLTASWLVTTPWSLSWYDVIVWAPLALLASNHLDGLLIWRGAALSIGYVTARSVAFSESMTSASWWLREVISSTVSYGVLIVIVAWWWGAGREMPNRDFIRRGWARLTG